MKTLLALNFILIALLLPSSGWCQNNCQLAFKDSEQMNLALSELVQLRQTLSQHPGSPLSPMIKKEFALKLKAAITLYGPEFETKFNQANKSIPELDRTEELTQRSDEEFLSDLISVEFRGEGYSPKMNELVPQTRAKNANVIVSIPNILSDQTFAARYSETTFKQINEYYFITRRKIYEVEPITKIKRFFGPTDNNTTGAISQNNQWAALVHPEKIYLWDLSKQNSKELRLAEAERELIPQLEFDRNNQGALHSKISNNGNWIVVPYYGFIINLKTGEVRQLKKDIEFNNQSGVHFEFSIQGDNLYFSSQNRLYKLDLSQGIHAKEELIFQLPPAANGYGSYFITFMIQPLENFIAFTASDSTSIRLLNKKYELVHQLDPTDGQQQQQHSLLKYDWTPDGRYLISAVNAYLPRAQFSSRFMVLDIQSYNNRIFFDVEDFHDVFLVEIKDRGFAAIGKFKNTSLQKNFSIK